MLSDHQSTDYYSNNSYQAMAEQVIKVGTQSYTDNSDKLTDSHIELFYQDNFDVPLVKGCAAWLIYRLIPEQSNQQNYDLFIGEVIGA